MRVHRLNLAVARAKFPSRFWVYLAGIILAVALLSPLLFPRFDFDGSQASSTSLTLGPITQWNLAARRVRAGYPHDKPQTYGWIVWIGPLQVVHLEHGVMEGSPAPGYTRIFKISR